MTKMSRVGRHAGLGIFIASWTLAASAALAADNVVLKRFGSGPGLNAVGMVEATQDVEVAAPQALYAGENGELYLLDQVNGRVLRFDAKKPAETRSLELPEDLQPTDLVVRKGEILVWDGQVHALQPTGQEEDSIRGLSETRAAGPPDVFASSAFAQMGSQPPGNEQDLLDANTRSVSSKPRNARSRQYVATRGQGPIIIDVIPGERKNARLEVRRQNETNLLAKINLEVRDRLGGVEFLEIDRQGRMFVLVENIPALAEGAAAYVARYSPGGKLESIYDIPLSQSVALSRRFVTISPDGEVYFLRTNRDAVDVVGVGSRTVRSGTLIDDPWSSRLSQFSPTEGRKGGPVAAVRPLTRQQVVETAFAFEGIKWRLSNSAHGREPDTSCTGFHQRIRRPGYLIGHLGQEVKGIPYCWGCHGSLAQIRSKIDRGMLAGNVCTRNEPRTDAVGVDCSAFVSAAWGLANHFTTAAIPAITVPVGNPWDMRPGDALNKPNAHVMLFLRFTPDRKAEVMEASPGACNGRVCRNVYPLSSILARGYKPVRFRALENEPAPPASVAAAEHGEPGHQARPKRHKRRNAGS